MAVLLAAFITLFMLIAGAMAQASEGRSAAPSPGNIWTQNVGAYLRPHR